MEGWRSLADDPSSDSAHRFLADAYSVLPRHEIARVSEILQSQLYQPLNAPPGAARGGAEQVVHPPGRGPADPAFNEYNQLFERNGISLLASGLVGSNNTFGDQVQVSATLRPFVGQPEPAPLRDRRFPREQRPRRGTPTTSSPRSPSAPRRACWPSSGTRTSSRGTCPSGSTRRTSIPTSGRTRRPGRPSGLPPRVRAGLRADRDGRLPGHRVPDRRHLPGFDLHTDRRDGSERSSTPATRAPPAGHRRRLLRRRPDRLVDRPELRSAAHVRDDRRHPPRQRLPLHAAQLAGSGHLDARRERRLLRQHDGGVLPRPGQPEGGHPVDPASRARRSAPPSSGRSSASCSPARRSSRRRSPGSTSSSTTSTAPTPGATGSAWTRSSAPRGRRRRVLRPRLSFPFDTSTWRPGAPVTRPGDWKEYFVRAYAYWAPFPGWRSPPSTSTSASTATRDPGRGAVHGAPHTPGTARRLAFFHPIGSPCGLATYINQEGTVRQHRGQQLERAARTRSGWPTRRFVPAPEAPGDHHARGAEPHQREVPLPGHRPLEPDRDPGALHPAEVHLGLLTLDGGPHEHARPSAWQ